MSSRVTRYEIRDERGEVVAIHVRRDREDGGKDMAWERPDGASGLGGLRTSQLPLYGSQDIVSWDESEPVIIVEGEKAREALTKHGFRALATVTGAAGCPDLEPLAMLRGRRVILWPDADAVGADHMLRLAERLKSVATSVGVFEWAAAPEHGDAADYLAGGSDAAERLRVQLGGVTLTEAGLGRESVVSPSQLVAVAFERLPEKPTRDELVAALRRLASLLNGHDDLDRTAGRHEAIERLKASGLPHREAQDLAGAALKGDKVAALPQRLKGTALELADPEPWPSVVDGPELANEIAAIFTRLVVLPPGAADALALWTLHAHAHEASEVSPILALTSAERRSGKTSTLILLRALAPRALMASNITSAVLYRTVEAFRPTLLVDEADTFLLERDELRGVLNAGHVRAAAVVPRCVGDAHEPQLFSTWCPKAIAMIGRLPGTLEDRSIPIQLRRKAPGELAERLQLHRLSEFEPVRQRARRWTQDHLHELRGPDPAVPPELHDRAQDNWRPLFAIADVLSGDWPARARHAALALAAAMPESDSAGEMLLADILNLFKEDGGDRLSSEAVVAALLKLEARPWPEWRGKGLTKNQLARQLKKFGIEPRTIRLADGTTAKGYYRESFDEAWTRYLPSRESSHRHNAASMRLELDSESVTEASAVTDRGFAGAAAGADCDVVTDWEVPAGGDPPSPRPGPLQTFMDGVLGGPPL